MTSSPSPCHQIAIRTCPSPVVCDMNEDKYGNQDGQHQKKRKCVYQRSRGPLSFDCFARIPPFHNFQGKSVRMSHTSALYSILYIPFPHLSKNKQKKLLGGRSFGLIHSISFSLAGKFWFVLVCLIRDCIVMIMEHYFLKYPTICCLLFSISSEWFVLFFPLGSGSPRKC